MSDQIKYFLEENKMPKTWYNIAADLPKPMEPPLHPESGRDNRRQHLPGWR